MIEINDDLVAHIARLCRLALSPAEAREIRTHFEKVLGFAAELDELDLSGVEPLFAVGAANVLQDDEPRASLPVEKALENAPESSNGFFVVPRVVQSAGEVDEEATP